MMSVIKEKEVEDQDDDKEDSAQVTTDRYPDSRRQTARMKSLNEMKNQMLARLQKIKNQQEN